MLYRAAKLSGKNAAERENLKKSPGVVNGDKKSGKKPSGEAPTFLETFNDCGKSLDDPRDKSKPSEQTRGNSHRDRSGKMEQLGRHATSTAGDKRVPPRNENLRGNGSHCAKNGEKYKSFEKPTRSNDPSSNKNPTEMAKTQKADFSKERFEFRLKSYIHEFYKRRADPKIAGRSPEENKNCDLERERADGKRGESRERECDVVSKKEIFKSHSAVGPVSRRRRSEIPLLKSRQISEKKPETVSLLMQKTLKENSNAISVHLCRDSAPADEFDAIPEMTVILGAEENSSRSDEMGEVNSLRSSTRRLSETSEDPFTYFKCSDAPLGSYVFDQAVAEKKTLKATKAKTLDLERVKTSSITILRAEGDSFSRLESFHQQNITAKETARAEIASKASKILLMAKASVSSTSAKKHPPPSGSDKGNQPSLKMKRKTLKHESQEINNGPEELEAPPLDVTKESPATGKVGCSITKRVADGKKNKNVNVEEKSLTSRGMAESGEKSERKIISKVPTTEKESSRKNKIHPNPEEAANVKSPPVTVESKPEEVPKDTPESCSVKTTESSVTESPSKNVDATPENNSEEILDEELKLTPRELASLVVTGTALNFDDIKTFEQSPEVNKIKLEIKIDVPSEEDATDSDAFECESIGNVSRASFDWLLMSKMQNCEKQNFEPPHPVDKASNEKLNSWHILAEELIAGECHPDETVLLGAQRSLSTVKRRPHLKKTLININGIEKKSKFESSDRWSLSGDPYNCAVFVHNKNRDAASFTRVRSGLTKASNRDEKIFDDPTSLKLRRRNSEPYSLRGFIRKRADVTSVKSLKPSVSSVASSLRHLNTDDLDDFIFWEAVPQKLTSCWEMSLYHFKRPWSVLSFSVFKDNRRSNTPGLILDTLRSGGVTNTRPPLPYHNDRIHRCKGNIFDVEPSISQKNIDIRNWLAALNFTAPVANTTDVVSETVIPVPPVLDTQKQVSPRRRNVTPQLSLQDKLREKNLYTKVKNHKFDKWSISEAEDLKELIRKESGSYVTKEQYILSEFSNLRSAVVGNACTFPSSSETEVPKETDGRDSGETVKKAETSCQSEPTEAQEQLKLKETPASSFSSLKSEAVSLPPEVNIWKYLFLFTLMFIIFHYSLRG